jgi:hypothetical protein
MNNYEQYRMYLKSPEWNTIRLAKLKDSGYKCQDCGVTGDEELLDVHHVRYRLWGSENLADLEVLCRPCHDLQHAAPQDVLLTLAPPVRLERWLREVLDRKRAKGEEIPPAFLRWLDRWKRIRERLPTEADVLTEEEWRRVGELCW